MRSTILKRIYPFYILAVVLSLALVIAYASGRFGNFYHQQMEKKLLDEALLLRAVFPPEFLSDPGRAQDFVARASRGRSSRITIVLRDGTVLADSARDPAELGDHGARPEILRAFHGAVGTSRRRSESLSEDLLYVAVPLEPEGPPAAVVRAAEVLRGPRAELRDLYTGIVLAGAVILAAAAAAGYIITRRISGPLRTIQEAALRFADGDLDTRLAVSRPREAKILASTLNRMAEQLRRRIDTIERQRNEVESILAGMTEAVVLLDRDRNIRSLNRAAEALFAVSRNACAGRSLLEIHRNSELDALARAIPGDGSPVENTVDLRQGGRLLHLQVHGTRIPGAGGEPEGMLLVLNDITRMKRLEEIRKDFVANVSHELKTPITAIQGFVETLLDGAADDPALLRRHLGIVETQAKRLDSIIEDLLSLSRLEAAETEIRTEETEAAAVVDAVFETCLPKAREKKIELSLKIPPSLTVRANPVLLEQALLNLTNNAVAYSGPGASVVVSAEERPGEVLFLVEDTGPGIPPADLPRIFERFYRVDKTRSRESGGTGLGLAIVKHIAAAHGGSVRAESELGRGSRFFISLPARET